MLKFVAFKTQKPRAFNYKPLYYNPEKEAREERRREILSQRGVFVDQDTQKDRKTGGKQEYSPGQFIANKRHSRISASSSRTRTSNRIKIFTLLVIVLVMGYWIFVM